MKKKSTSTSAFFSLRVLIGLFLVVASIFLALVGFGAFSNAAAQANVNNTTLAGQTQQAIGQQVGQMTVISAVHSDLSPPLRDQPVIWPQAREEREAPEHRKIPLKYEGGPDPVIQSSLWQQPMAPPAIPAPIGQFDGISKQCNGCIGGAPPDTNGAVGKTQYVEMVNRALEVFDKLTGTSLLGPFPFDSIWFGFGGACQNGGIGDPVVVYDKLADRWIISQFAKPSPYEDVDPQDECIAVSENGDATGAWYRYGYHLTSLFLDYPKFGVWPDGYYMSANIFRPESVCSGNCFLAPQPFVFDRAKMLVGDPTATAQTPGLIGQPQQEDPLLPSDLDGILPPPPGDPNHFVEVTGDKNVPPEQKPLAGALATPTPTATPVSPIYKVWDFHVDWIYPGNSRFSIKASLRGAGFTVLSCVDEEGKKTESCVPQKDTPNKLDSSPGFLMFRNAYRRFSDGRESLLNNLTVDAPIGHDSVAAIRWFELQRAIPANWTIRQQSTYRPDNTWRWLGSIASDNQGNIALGFSASSATINPQIRYAGRRATDPLGNLSGEQHLYNGTLSQIGFDPPQGDDPHRWGDYSAMTVDSVDDCTFYYTNEYYICPGCPFFTTPPYTWQTRIGYFRFGQCTPPQKGTGHFVVRFVCDPGTPVANASVSIDGFSYGATLANGTYDAVLPPGSHSYVVSSPAFATQTGNFTISNGQTTVVGVCLGGRGAVADFNGDGHPDYLLHNSSTRETAIWYLNNSLFISGAYGPTLSPGWSLESVADFNLDSHPDYALFAPSTDRTAIWYLNNNVLINALYGPTLPAGWTLIATADFNGDGYPDYVLYNMNNRRTAIWYLNNNVLVDALYGPTLPADWTLIATADFNGDGHPDYLLYNMHNGRTAIWYLNNNILVNALYGPTLPVGWAVVATADFNGDGHPDYVLYKARTGETAIWYLNNNILVNAAYGPTLSDAWSLIAP